MHAYFVIARCVYMCVIVVYTRSYVHVREASVCMKVVLFCCIF